MGFATSTASEVKMVSWFICYTLAGFGGRDGMLSATIHDCATEEQALLKFRRSLRDGDLGRVRVESVTAFVNRRREARCVSAA